MKRSNKLSGTLNGQERPEMFEVGRSNVLERIVENAHGSKARELL